MKGIILAAGIACCAGPALGETTLGAPADVAAIKAFEQRNAEQLDAKALARTYAPDAASVAVYQELYGLYRKLYFGFGARGGESIPCGDVLPALRRIAAAVREH